MVRRTRRSVRSRREVTDDGSSERYRTRRCNVHRRAGTRVATCQTRQQRFFFTQFVSRRSAFGAAVSGARAAEMDVASERLGRLSLRDGRGGGARSDAAPSDDAWNRRKASSSSRSPAGAESSTSATRCRGCGSRISGKYLVAPNGASYHPDCLACELCRARVRSFVSVKTRPDLLCCASCHDARFAETCARCRAPLHGSILSALGVKWHADCFRCSICDAPHVSTFVEHDGGAVCKPCHLAHVAERCAGCGEGIDGEFLRALGRKYHRGCFRCVECRADVSTSYLTHDDRPWCRACHVAVHAERCACGCGRGVEGSIVSALGKKYLDGHFRCAECRGAFANGSFVRVASRAGGEKDTAVCDACYAANHAEKCAVCATALVNCRFSRTTDHGEPMCVACARAPGAVCDDCGRCVPERWRRRAAVPSSSARRTARRASGGEAIVGQCESCARSAVLDDASAARLMNRVIAALTGMGARGVDPDARINVELVDADRLARAADKRHRGPNAAGPRGVTRTKIALEGVAPRERWTEIVDGWALERARSETERAERRFASGKSPGTTRRDAKRALADPDVEVRERRFLKGVMLLRGMSENAAGAVLAHEYGHCYLFLGRFPALELRDEEGICELFAWMWLGGGLSVSAATTTTVNGEDESANARRRRLMETREDPVYGDGFRAAKRGLDACGGNLAKFLEHVRRHGELPR